MNNEKFALYELARVSEIIWQKKYEIPNEVLRFLVSYELDLEDYLNGYSEGFRYKDFN